MTRAIIIVAMALVVWPWARQVPEPPPPLLLRDGTIHTVAGATLPSGDILIREGRIAEIGADVQAPGATVVDCAGQQLYPGLIAAASQLGLSEIGAVRATIDTHEVGAYTPDLRSWFALNPDSLHLGVTRAAGIAHALSAPAGGTVAGLSAVIRLDGWTFEELVVKAPAALHVYWPGQGLDLRPQHEWSDPKQFKSIEEQEQARRKALGELEDFFADARAYHDQPAAARLSDPAWEALLPVIAGEIPVMIHADEERQLRSALAWARSEKLRAIIVGGRDAWRLADELARDRVPVIYESINDLPSRDDDPYDVQYRAPAILRRAGVTLAFGRGGGAWSTADLRNLAQFAAQALPHGLDPEDALAGITLAPARILGLDDRLGSIEVGKEATLIAADGDILEVTTRVTRMWLEGRPMDLSSHHTRLYDRYRLRPRPQ